MIEIIFNNKNSYVDLGINVESFNIQPPSKKKIKDSVPFMNGSFDFSTVGSNGEVTYTERSIMIRFYLVQENRADLFNKYSQVLDWLLGVGQSKLVFCDMPDCYYLAEVENAPTFDNVIEEAGVMEVEFIAYPFKFGVNLEGTEQPWDTFNFQIDYIQESKFEITGSKTVEIFNVGRAVSPVAKCTSDMSVSLDGYTSNFKAGDNSNWRFILKPGANTININGTGNVEFKFRKELL